MDELRQIYRQAMVARIQELEAALSGLVRATATGESEIRRVAHSLRGSGTTYGFPAVSAAATAVEEAKPEMLARSTEQLLGVLRVVAGPGQAMRGGAPAAAMVSILVVDDDPEMQLLLRYVLAGDGREVVFAATTADAWSALASARFDLILLDLLLPDGDGRALLRRIRADPDHRATPVLVLSARDSTTARDHCLELGADDFFEKPFDPERIRDAVLARLPSVAG